MILEVPYKSQVEIESTEEKKWCGLACLFMVMRYYLKESAPSLKELHQEYGEAFENNGYQHKDLLNIAKKHNLRGFRKSWWASPGDQQLIERFKEEGEGDADIKDWAETNLEEGLFTIEECIKNEIPVIVSVSKEFSPSTSTHLVVIIGVEEDDFILHDSYKKGENYKISKDEFKKYWLRQAIIVKKG